MNQIHPTVLIGKRVLMGDHNVILPYTILEDDIEIGNDNIIGPFVTIGSPAANTRNKYEKEKGKKIRIGHRNIIREHSAIQKPVFNPETRIGNDTFIMQGANISHDAILENETVLAANVSLAGFTQVLEGAYIAMGASINQFTVIGPYAIVATNAAAMRHVKPFSRYIPSKPLSVNHYAIQKFGFNAIKEEIMDYVLHDINPTHPKLREILNQFHKSIQAQEKRKNDSIFKPSKDK